MNSDTPETDAAIPRDIGLQHFVLADFARKLERERNALEIRHAAVMLHAQSVVDENNQLRKVCDELFKSLSFVSSEEPKNDILCPDGFTMSFHKNSPLHEDMKAAIKVYNQLPHVKEKNK